MAELVQCPSCGGYKTYRATGHRFDFLPATVYGVCMLGVGLLVTIPVCILTRVLESQDRKDRILCHKGCNLCGYEWMQRPGQVLPITDDLELRRKGAALLEEKARLNAAAAYQQQRNRD
jgi:hypothetical protein